MKGMGTENEKRGGRAGGPLFRLRKGLQNADRLEGKIKIC